MRVSAKNVADLKKKVEEAGGRSEGFAPLSGKFLAILDSAEAVVFKSGSFGLKLVYKLTAKDVKGRKIFDNVVLRGADGKPTKYGMDTVARRLKAFGISYEDMETFEIPDDDKSQGDLQELHGAKVVLKLERGIIETGPKKGESTTELKGVYAEKE